MGKWLAYPTAVCKAGSLSIIDLKAEWFSDEVSSRNNVDKVKKNDE